MYTDVVDLSVLHCSPSVGSLSEVQALVAGKPNMTRAEEAMELYHIALFLEFNMLAQAKFVRKCFYRKKLKFATASKRYDKSFFSQIVFRY